jgi:putative inorganic carbon (HCO3(-)) transporter
MRRHSEAAIFWLTAASAAASLVSIAAMEILMAAAGLLWLYTRSSLKWPPYTLPLLAFMATTLISLANSSNPSVGWHPIQKFVLFFMGLLAVAFVTTESRARAAYKLLVVTATVAGAMAIVQFVFKEFAYRNSGQLADDPTLLNRITGPLGHWMTFSGVQLLVWCAAVPALMVLGRRWMPAVAIIGTAIVLSNTRGAWLGAAAGFAFVAFALPRRVLAGALIPMILVGLAASPWIYHRVSMSLDKGLATNYSRAIYLDVGMKMIKAHPLVGVGPERVHADFPRYYPGRLDSFYYGHLHNNFLQIAAERGLLCLAAFLWFLVELYRSLLRLLRSQEDDSRWVTLGAIAALTGFVVAGLTEYNFGDSEVLVLLLFIVSIPFGLASHVQKDPHSEPG